MMEIIEKLCKPLTNIMRKIKANKNREKRKLDNNRDKYEYQKINANGKFQSHLPQNP